MLRQPLYGLALGYEDFGRSGLFAQRLGSTSAVRMLARASQRSSRSSKPAGGSKSLFATTSAQSCQGWATFQLTESPNSLPPPGRPETNRPKDQIHGRALRLSRRWHSCAEGVPWVLKRIIRNALAERSMQEKSISMKSSQSETTGDQAVRVRTLPLRGARILEF